ncbi:hypothetical protein FY034_04765 [Trichlorobacter lovleyi]|uniref:hypothetical protein n=1 Tax=Trichlorobacter lovleyi TaxID=313985 RepID=UPI00223F4899|nr:hypothetical protein [Trichlorobacter lovleyi]QOX78272.1 hypothetical protein FY034_04765 [Trichlorobacter lovleyi]
MSVKIRIGNQEHDLLQADKHWIISQIREQQNDSGSVCVQIAIKKGNINMRLCSGACPSTGSGGDRQATQQELRIFELWEKHGGKQKHLGGGEIVAFLEQLQRIL